MSVYTVVNEAELKAFLSEYTLGELTHFEGISAGIENTNYFVDTTQGRFVLTVFEHHTFDELPYFLDIMAFMAEHNIPTAHPKPLSNGGYLKAIQGKPAALVERLSGDGVESPTTEQCEVMGEQMARFHLAGEEFKGFRKNDRDIDWMQDTFKLLEGSLPDDEKTLIASELQAQTQIEWSSLPQGVIHADLFCDNALFNGENLSGIIDLYYACNSTFLYDLAVMVNDWCRTKDFQLDAERVRAVLNHYQTVRPLTDEEKTFWPFALRLGALRFFLSRLKDKHLPREGEMTQIKNPDVFKALLTYHRNQRHTV